jgi:hypothetical protein
MFVETLIDNGTKADILDIVIWAFVLIIILSLLGYVVAKMHDHG